MNGRTRLVEAGAGRPTVLVHGVGLDHTMWDEVVEDLAASRIVVRYDLLGHGATADADGPRSLDDFADQCLAVIDQLETPVDVVGLSLGALIALRTAARAPERVRRLVVVSTAYGRRAEQQAAVEERLAVARHDGMDPIASRAIDRWFTTPWQAAHPETIDGLHTRLTTTDLDGYLKAYEVFVASDDLVRMSAGGLVVPTLVVAGEHDPASTPEMAHRLSEDLADARCVILPDLHHVPPIEAPDTFTDAIISYLDEELTS